MAPARAPSQAALPALQSAASPPFPPFPPFPPQNRANMSGHEVSDMDCHFSHTSVLDEIMSTPTACTLRTDTWGTSWGWVFRNRVPGGKGVAGGRSNSFWEVPWEGGTRPPLREGRGVEVASVGT